MAEDRSFLFAVFASTREGELSPVPWSAEQKAAFLEQQFHAQDTHYRGQYPDAEFLVVLADGERIGRLSLLKGAGKWHVLDIALLPGCRRRGIGTQLLGDVLADADAAGAMVSLYVETHNPARRLYTRLGFVEVEAGPVYDRLERPVRRTAVAGES